MFKALLLLQIDFVDMLLVGDVGRDLDADGASVNPADGALVQLIPVAGEGVLDFAIVEFAGQVVGRELGRIERQCVAHRAAGGGDQRRIAADGVEAENVLESPVGEEDFAGAGIGHVHRCIEAVDHRHETFVGAFEFDAGALRFGNVVHRGHPADLQAVGVDQWREVEAHIEAFAVLAHDAHLEAGGRGLAGQRLVDIALQAVELFRGPVWVGRRNADQFRFVEAGHAAESGIDEGDPAFEIDRAHAGDQRLRHGLAESVGGT